MEENVGDLNVRGEIILRWILGEWVGRM